MKNWFLPPWFIICSSPLCCCSRNWDSCRKFPSHTHPVPCNLPQLILSIPMAYRGLTTHADKVHTLAQILESLICKFNSPLIGKRFGHLSRLWSDPEIVRSGREEWPMVRMAKPTHEATLLAITTSFLLYFAGWGWQESWWEIMRVLHDGLKVLLCAQSFTGYWGYRDSLSLSSALKELTNK